jgi:peptide-methionine (S)-S-oxide reductase
LKHGIILLVAIVLGLGYAWLRGAALALEPRMAALVEEGGPATTDVRDGTAQAHACFAGGCYWSVQELFRRTPGVVRTVAGTVDGVESVRVSYDPRRVSYGSLLDRYWHGIDPFTATGQFCDLGERYRPLIFVADAAAREVAEASRRSVEARFGRAVAVGIAAEARFVPAAESMQHFAERHRVQYAYYAWSCGRTSRLTSLWGPTQP